MFHTVNTLSTIVDEYGTKIQVIKNDVQQLGNTVNGRQGDVKSMQEQLVEIHGGQPRHVYFE